MRLTKLALSLLMALVSNSDAMPRPMPACRGLAAQLGFDIAPNAAPSDAGPSLSTQLVDMAERQWSSWQEAWTSLRPLQHDYSWAALQSWSMFDAASTSPLQSHATSQTGRYASSAGDSSVPAASLRAIFDAARINVAHLFADIGFPTSEPAGSTYRQWLADACRDWMVEGAAGVSLVGSTHAETPSSNYSSPYAYDLHHWCDENAYSSPYAYDLHHWCDKDVYERMAGLDASDDDVAPNNAAASDRISFVWDGASDEADIAAEDSTWSETGLSGATYDEGDHGSYDESLDLYYNLYAESGELYGDFADLGLSESDGDDSASLKVPHVNSFNLAADWAEEMAYLNDGAFLHEDIFATAANRSDAAMASTDDRAPSSGADAASPVASVGVDADSLSSLLDATDRAFLLTLGQQLSAPAAQRRLALYDYLHRQGWQAMQLMRRAEETGSGDLLELAHDPLCTAILLRAYRLYERGDYDLDEAVEALREGLAPLQDRWLGDFRRLLEQDAASSGEAAPRRSSTRVAQMHDGRCAQTVRALAVALARAWHGKVSGFQSQVETLGALASNVALPRLADRTLDRTTPAAAGGIAR